VLFLFRCVELPARVFSYTLFAARFQLFVFLVAGIDLLVLILIRASTVKRMQLKRDRSREALNRSLAAVNKNSDMDLSSLGVVEDEEDSKMRMDWKWTIFHFCAWQLVYLEGIDAVPFFCLRILEMSGMTALFLLLNGGVTDLGQFQSSGLICAAIFCALYAILSPIWQFYRSHASFLHPTFRQPTQLQLKVMEALVQRPLGAEEEEHEEAAKEVQNESIQEQKEVIEPVQHKAPREREEITEEESSESSESSEEEEQAPAPPVVIVKEVAPPPRDMKTMETQYNWEQVFLDREVEPDAVVDKAVPITYQEKANCRSCTTDKANPNTCLVM